MTDDNAYSISVVIPCYNCVTTIEKCLTSVFNQSLLPLEVILVDDGSMDNTFKKIEELKQTCSSDVDLIILKQKNSGPSAARNNGIYHCKGSWIAFLDSDDYWDVNKLKNQMKFIRNNPSIKLLGCADLDVESRLIAFKCLLKKNLFQTSSVLISKKEAIDYAFNVNQKYSEDYRTWLNVVYFHKSALINPAMAFPVESIDKNFKASGLSSSLWEMEKGELSNYKMLFDTNKIDIITFWKISLFSFLKYIKRLAAVKLIK